MGRPKRNVNRPKSKDVDVSDMEEYYDKVDTSASNFIYDAVDEYHENQDKEGMQKLSKLMRKPKPFSEEAVLGVATSSDEEESKPQKRKKKKTKKLPAEAEPLPGLDSDLDEERGGDEDEMTSTWGTKKSAYYNADYVDEDRDDADESDAERAELELKEALAIQQRMAEQLEEADFGLDFISHLKAADKVKGTEKSSAEEVKIDVNLSQLSKREKLELLNKESPELMELIEDFCFQMTELKENLAPILNLISTGVIPPSPAADFIKAKHQLITNYCTQIGFYFVLKSKRESVQNHPVIKRLVQFRSLLHQLENGGAKLQSEMDDILRKIKEGHPISQEDFNVVVPPPRKKLRILSKETKDKTSATNGDVQKKTSKQAKTKDSNETLLTRDEQGAVEFYKGIRQTKDESESDRENSDDEPAEPGKVGEEVAVEENEAVGKRAINYQISKNKGLTPHRPKEQRNPRVKHRMKFRKASIRRKGAVREPRKENERYAGEVSGIKAAVVRSTKLR